MVKPGRPGQWSKFSESIIDPGCTTFSQGSATPRSRRSRLRAASVENRVARVPGFRLGENVVVQFTKVAIVPGRRPVTAYPPLSEPAGT